MVFYFLRQCCWIYWTLRDSNSWKFRLNVNQNSNNKLKWRKQNCAGDDRTKSSIKINISPLCQWASETTVARRIEITPPHLYNETPVSHSRSVRCAVRDSTVNSNNNVELCVYVFVCHLSCFRAKHMRQNAVRRQTRHTSASSMVSFFRLLRSVALLTSFCFVLLIVNYLPNSRMVNKRNKAHRIPCSRNRPTKQKHCNAVRTKHIFLSVISKAVSVWSSFHSHHQCAVRLGAAPFCSVIAGIHEIAFYLLIDSRKCALLLFAWIHYFGPTSKSSRFSTLFLCRRYFYYWADWLTLNLPIANCEFKIEFSFKYFRFTGFRHGLDPEFGLKNHKEFLVSGHDQTLLQINRRKSSVIAYQLVVPIILWFTFLLIFFAALEIFSLNRVRW